MEETLINSKWFSSPSSLHVLVSFRESLSTVYQVDLSTQRNHKILSFFLSKLHSFSNRDDKYFTVFHVMFWWFFFFPPRPTFTLCSAESIAELIKHSEHFSMKKQKRRDKKKKKENVKRKSVISIQKNTHRDKHEDENPVIKKENYLDLKNKRRVSFSISSILRITAHFQLSIVKSSLKSWTWQERRSLWHFKTAEIVVGIFQKFKTADLLRMLFSRPFMCTTSKGWAWMHSTSIRSFHGVHIEFAVLHSAAESLEMPF